VKRLHGLDAMRGFAALLVAFHHLSFLSGHGGLGDLPLFAVDLFFALSGFVMARTYEARLRAGSLTATSFVALRYRRLWLPLAIGSTISVAVGTQTGMPLSASTVAAYALILAFLPAPWLYNAFIINVPAWSLFLEIIANACHGRFFARIGVRPVAAMTLASAFLTVVLLGFGYARWGPSALSILSCLPRELTFYLSGILIFRRYGDAPFQFATGQWAVWFGALSYPLYATHVPVMGLALWLGAPPAGALAAALSFAWLVAIVAEARLSSRRFTRQGSTASVKGES
jgi:peptidoglycan/LPS O-acetylase OafA/YrhL